MICKYGNIKPHFDYNDKQVDYLVLVQITIGMPSAFKTEVIEIIFSKVLMWVAKLADHFPCDISYISFHFHKDKDHFGQHEASF